MSATDNSQLKDVKRRHAPQRLSAVNFDVVGSCQLRCVGCPISGLTPRPEFMAPDLFRRCLANIDVPHITLFRLFNFGEPLLHPRLEEIGRILLDSPIRMNWVEISTNAQCNAEERLEALVAMGALDILTISCDGDGTPEKYEALRPPARWSKLLSFLAFARDLAARYPKLKLRARCVIEDPADAQRWRELLAPYHVRPEFRGWLQLPDSLRDRARETVPMGEGGCAIAAAGNTLYVDHHGNIVPCCFHPRAGLFGNLAEARFSDLFAGEKRAAFLEAIVHQRADMPVCNRCDIGGDIDAGPSAEAITRFQQ